jgi:hypothetical protein
MQSAKKFLSSCPSEIYYVVSQPGVSSSDLSSSAAHLKNALSNPAVHSRFTVSEVVGLDAADADDLQAYLQSQCGSKTADVSDVASALKQRTDTQGSSVIVREKYPSIPGNVEGRASMVVDAGMLSSPKKQEVAERYHRFVAVPGTQRATQRIQIHIHLHYISSCQSGNRPNRNYSLRGRLQRGCAYGPKAQSSSSCS